MTGKSLDPDQLLTALRMMCRQWAVAPRGSRAEWYAASAVTERFGQLDAILSAGGPLPTDWVPERERDPEPARDTENIPLPGGASPVLPYPPATAEP